MAQQSDGGVSMKFRRNFKKTIYGFAEAEADSIEKAKEKFNDGDDDWQHDNNSDCEWDDDIVQQD